jgi:hypothetical protein
MPSPTAGLLSASLASTMSAFSARTLHPYAHVIFFFTRLLLSGRKRATLRRWRMRTACASFRLPWNAF